MNLRRQICGSHQIWLGLGLDLGASGRVSLHTNCCFFIGPQSLTLFCSAQPHIELALLVFEYGQLLNHGVELR